MERSLNLLHAWSRLMRKRLGVLAVTLVAVCAVPFPVQAQSDKGPRVRAICSTAPEWCQLAAKEFERLSGIRVEQEYLSTHQALQRLRAERGKPQTDVWWGGTGAPFQSAASQGLLDPYRPPYINDLHAWSVRQYAMTQDRVGGLYSSAIGLGWNTQRMSQLRLPEPRCWSDLIKPVYRGQIALPDPANSGTAYLWLTGLVQLMGEDAAFDYFKRLHANVASYEGRGIELVQKVAQGQVPLAVGFIFGFEGRRLEGAPLRTAAPCEGTAYEIGGIALVSGRPNRDASKSYYDWLMGPAGQGSAARANSLQVPANKTYRRDRRIPVLDDVPLIRYDFEKYAHESERRRLLGRWASEVAATPR